MGKSRLSYLLRLCPSATEPRITTQKKQVRNH